MWVDAPGAKYAWGAKLVTGPSAARGSVDQTPTAAQGFLNKEASVKLVKELLPLLPGGKMIRVIAIGKLRDRRLVDLR